MLEIAGFIIGVVSLLCSIDAYIKTGALVSKFRDHDKALRKLRLELTVQQDTARYQCKRILWNIYDGEKVEKLLRGQVWDEKALAEDLKRNTGDFFDRIGITLLLVRDDLDSVKGILDRVGENPKDFHELILRTEKLGLSVKSQTCEKSSFRDKFAWEKNERGLKEYIKELRDHNFDLKNAVDDWTASRGFGDATDNSNSVTTGNSTSTFQKSHMSTKPSRSQELPSPIQQMSRNLLRYLKEIDWCKCHSIHWGFEVEVRDANVSNPGPQQADFNFLLAPERTQTEEMSGVDSMPSSSSPVAANFIVARLRSKKLATVRKSNVMNTDMQVMLVSEENEIGCSSKDGHGKRRRNNFSQSTNCSKVPPEAEQNGYSEKTRYPKNGHARKRLPQDVDHLKTPPDNTAYPRPKFNGMQEDDKSKSKVGGLCSNLARLKHSRDQQYVGGIGSSCSYAHDLYLLGGLAFCINRLTLRELLENTTTTPTPPPNVRERLHLALTLSNAILYLPPTIFPRKWRSEHVSLFEHPQQTNRGPARRSFDLYFKPNFKRPTNTQAHPSSGTSEHSLIRKVGLVLLDLGLEGPLPTGKVARKNINEQGMNSYRHPAEIAARCAVALDMVLRCMGSVTYQEVVKSCIFWDGSHNLYQEQTRELFTEKVLLKLKVCMNQMGGT